MESSARELSKEGWLDFLRRKLRWIRWAVETMPEILLAFSHGFTEVWHYDQIAASRSIFLLDLSTRTTVPYSCIRSRKFVPPSTRRDEVEL